jgi:2-amino-4-hydroxy-6-hydroxymethyldihydropteridine diphosphokinase
VSHRAVIALGSNLDGPLGDRVANLRFGLKGISPVTAVSNVFETAPVGGPDNQGAYLNMVAVVETELDPLSLLRLLNQIEADSGRKRLVHWGPRTLDLDILFYDDITMSSEVLTIPHPRFAERRFVLAPLSQVAPELCPIGWDSNLPPDEVIDRGAIETL